MEIPKPQTGTWILTTPNGMEFKAESPIKCCRKEQKTRIPKEVSAARLKALLDQCDLCEESISTFIMAKGTPAEIEVCETCRNTLLQHFIYSKSENKLIMPHTIKIHQRI
jgi:hypothetical protein